MTHPTDACVLYRWETKLSIVIIIIINLSTLYGLKRHLRIKNYNVIQLKIKKASLFLNDQSRTKQMYVWIYFNGKWKTSGPGRRHRISQSHGDRYYRSGRAAQGRASHPCGKGKWVGPAGMRVNYYNVEHERAPGCCSASTDITAWAIPSALWAAPGE